MPQDNVEIVRKPLTARERSRHTIDQRLSLRFPRLAAANARLIGRLPSGSRMRQAALWRGARLGVEAYNRRDPEAGLEGHGRYFASVDEVWGGENLLKPVVLIDLGCA